MKVLIGFLSDQRGFVVYYSLFERFWMIINDILTAGRWLNATQRIRGKLTIKEIRYNPLEYTIGTTTLEAYLC